MTRFFNDPMRGPTRVPSKAEIRTERIVTALKELGIEASDARCTCCGAHLVDLAHVTMTPDGLLGPECSRVGHDFACRRRRMEGGN